MEPSPQNASPTPGAQLAPRPTAAPLGVSAGFSFLAISYVVLFVASRLFRDDDDVARWALLAQATVFASLMLCGAGALELLRTTLGAARTGAKLAVAAVALLLGSSVTGVLGSAIVSTAVSAGLTEGASSEAAVWGGLGARVLWAAARWGDATGWHLFTAGLLLCGGSSPRVRRLAPFALLCSLIAHPYQFFAEFVGSLLLQRAAWAGQFLLLWLALRASIPEPELFGGWLRAGRALTRLGKAMDLRLLCAALTMLMSLGYALTSPLPTEDAPLPGDLVPLAASHPLIFLHLFAGPAGVVLSTAMAAAAAFSAGGLATFLAPRRHFYIGAALLSVTLSVRGLQLALAALAFPAPSEFARALPLLMPLLETAAFLLILFGCRRLAEQLESEALIEQASRAVLTTKAAQSIAVVAQLFLVGSSGAASSRAPTLAILLASAAPLASLFALSRLCRGLAQEIELRGELPEAVVQRRGSPEL